jgi:O-antigen/teichoic acid export membrane protein
VIFEAIRKARVYAAADGLGPMLVRSVAGSGAVRLAAMAASFAVGVQLARMLGVEGYGYYGLALSIITIAGIPGELGIPNLVTRETATAASRRDDRLLFAVLRWARRLILLVAGLMAVLAIGAVFVVSATKPSLLALTILFGAPAIPLMALARTEGAALQGMGHVVRGQVPANVLRPVFASLILLAVYVAGINIGAAGAMAINSVTAALALGVAYFWLRTRLPPEPPIAGAARNREWLASSIPMAMTDGIRTLQTELTVVLLGIIAAPVAVGYFRIATATAMMAAIANQVVAQVGIPVLARLYADRDEPRLQKTVTAFAWVQFGGIAIIALPLLLVPELLIGIVFGAEYVPAAQPLRILLVGHIISGVFGPNTILLNMAHQERRLTRAVAIATAVGLVLVAILPRYAGASGAAAAIVVWMTIWNVLTWRDARKYLGIETSIFRLGRPQRR